MRSEFLVLVLATALLTACGGGGGGGGDGDITPPGGKNPPGTPADRTPDPFVFTPSELLDAHAGQQIEAAATVRGFDGVLSARVSARSCSRETPVPCPTVQIRTGQSELADTVDVRAGETLNLVMIITPDAQAGEVFEATVTLGDGEAAQSASIRAVVAVDNTPAPFTLEDVEDATPGETYSASVTVADINVPVPVAVQGGALRVEGGQVVPGHVENGQQLTVLVTAPDEFMSSMSATLSIGDVTETFTVTTSAPEGVQIEFPPPVSLMPDSEVVRVRGIANDPDGITSVTVNGVVAELTPVSGNLVRWGVDAALVGGDNVLEVVATDSTGATHIDSANVNTQATSIGSGSTVKSFSFGVLDPDANIIHGTSFPARIVSWNLETGERVDTSNNQVGDGPDYLGLRGIARDAATGALYVLDHAIPAFSPGFLYAVDPATGDREELAAGLPQPSGPVYHAACRRIFYHNNQNDRMRYIDLDGPVCAAPVFGSQEPGPYVFDAAAEQMFFSRNGELWRVNLADGQEELLLGGLPTSAAIAAVDSGLQQLVYVGDSEVGIVTVATGERTVLAGRGPSFSQLIRNAVPVDRQKRVAYVPRASASRAIYAVDLVSGDRVFVSL